MGLSSLCSCREAKVSTLQAGAELALTEEAFLVSGRLCAEGPAPEAEASGGAADVCGPAILSCPPSSYRCLETSRVRLVPAKLAVSADL